MKLALLGTTGYHPNAFRHTSCYLLPEHGIMLDAGTGVFRLPQYLQTRTLDILLSHAHLDHIVGLTFLLGLLYGREMDRVTVHGDPEKLSAVRDHLYSPLIFPVPPTWEFRPLDSSGQMSCGGAKITWFPLEHPGGCLGYRLDWPARSLAYVTDTTAEADSPYIASVANADLLLHECNFPDSLAEYARPTGHSHTTKVAQLAQAANVKRLILTHLMPSVAERDPVGLATAQAIFANTQLAEDEQVLEF